MNHGLDFPYNHKTDVETNGWSSRVLYLTAE